jgi:hypothetical protein
MVRHQQLKTTKGCMLPPWHGRCFLLPPLLLIVLQIVLLLHVPLNIALIVERACRR